MNKRFLIILTVLIVGFAGFFWFSKNKASDSNSSSGNSQGTPSQHVKGQGTKVTLIEYGDYECSACAQWEPTVEQIRTKHEKDLKFQFRNFPLPQHQNAMAAHRAAEAASNQGKFWQMHDLLYSRQDGWSQSNNPGKIFEDYATELGLNVDKFKTDVASSVVNDTINADRKTGENIGVKSTPTFVINDKVVEPKNAEEFYKIIEDAIKNAS